MSYSFFMSIFNIPIFILQLVKLRLGQMRHIISTFVARVQILGTNALPQPRGVTGPLMWAVFWGFTHMGHVCSTDFGGRGPAGLGCTAVPLYMM